MKRTLLVMLLALIGALLFPLPAHALTADEWESKIRFQINQERTARGIQEVLHGNCVDGFAERHVNYLENNDILQHQNPSNIAAQCNGNKAGEIIARGYADPRATVNAWMNSSLHRAVLLDGAYERIGVGAQRDEDGSWYVVADFLSE